MTDLRAAIKRETGAILMDDYHYELPPDEWYEHGRNSYDPPEPQVPSAWAIHLSALAKAKEARWRDQHFRLGREYPARAVKILRELSE